MPWAVVRAIEQLTGESLAKARVYYDSSRPAEVGALAYAQGAEVHLAPGQEGLLLHEAWHLVQQRKGRVKPTERLEGGHWLNTDRSLEEEADVMARKLKGELSRGDGRGQHDQIGRAECRFHKSQTQEIGKSGEAQMRRGKEDRDLLGGKSQGMAVGQRMGIGRRGVRDRRRLWGASQVGGQPIQRTLIPVAARPGAVPPGLGAAGLPNELWVYDAVGNFTGGQDANINAAALYARPNPTEYRGEGWVGTVVGGQFAPALAGTNADSGEVENKRYRTSDRGHVLAKQNGGGAAAINMFRQDPATNRGLAKGDPDWRAAEQDFHNALLAAPGNGATHAVWRFSYAGNRNVLD